MTKLKLVKLPKGWYRGKPKAKNGIYATSKECLIKDGQVIGNGYAILVNGKWSRYKDWGNHVGASDMIWKRGAP